MTFSQNSKPLFLLVISVPVDGLDKKKTLFLLVILVPVYGFDTKTIVSICYICSWWGFWETLHKYQEFIKRLDLLDDCDFDQQEIRKLTAYLDVSAEETLTAPLL